jgi:hypothetical protein
MTANFILRLIALLFLLLAALSIALPVPFDLGWAGLFCWLLSEVIPGPSRPA